MQLPFFLGKKPVTTLHIRPPVTARLMAGELQECIPENASGYIHAWFMVNPVSLRISNPRTSKFGDYRVPVKNLPARISVNRNLNRFDFLITLVHEMAHHEVWIESSVPVSFLGIRRKRRRPRPHGKEWKYHYRRLLKPLMKESVFPGELLHLLEKHLDTARSSSKSDEQLVAALKKYDAPDDRVFMETLGFNAIFSYPEGRKFRKLEKLRKRYRCVCLENGKIYLFSPMVRVVPMPA